MQNDKNNNFIAILSFHISHVKLFLATNHGVCNEKKTGKNSKRKYLHWCMKCVQILIKCSRIEVAKNESSDE